MNELDIKIRDKLGASQDELAGKIGVSPRAVQNWEAGKVIMKWTGHSDYKAIKPYIKIVDKLKVSEMEKFNTFAEPQK